MPHTPLTSTTVSPRSSSSDVGCNVEQVVGGVRAQPGDRGVAELAIAGRGQRLAAIDQDGELDVGERHAERRERLQGRQPSRRLRARRNFRRAGKRLNRFSTSMVVPGWRATGALLEAAGLDAQLGAD